ncbi:MAG TPA: PAS domain S-box protein [Steroidobacteraceae bacterium]|nr:PAS domain S-box protein [Steroidobacteraceae bacterium]
MSQKHPVHKPATSPFPESYELLLASIRDYAIFMLDPKGHVLSWNTGAALIKGYEADEIIGSHFSRFYPEEAVRRGWPDEELRIAETEGRFENLGWRLRKDGSRFWASVVITAVRDESGQLRGFAKVTRDLTEQRRQQEALRISEERFRSLIEGVRDYAIFTLDPQGFITSWNAGARHIKGYEPHEIIGSHFSRFYTPEAIQRRWPDHELSVATMQGRFEDEGWRVRKDGSRFWANIVMTALRDAAGNLIGFSKITRDLTDRRRHEETIRQSEERLRLLIEGVHDYAIFMLDTNGLVTRWNSGAERIMGHEHAEILGKHFSYFYRPEEIASGEPWRDLGTVNQTGRVSNEGWRVRKDGSVFWANTVMTALHDTEGRPRGFAVVTRDLTQQRHTEALEDAARRMHEFVAMLAHELRNPLAPIRNAVNLMAKKGMGDPTLESMRQTIDRQSLHLTRIIDELLDVNRIARGHFTIERALVDLGEVLQRAIEASRPLIDARGHALHTDWPAQAIMVHGDAVRLTQVMVNLLNNAARYTQEGGKIALTVATAGIDVEIRVRDNGKGIPPEMLERIFGLFVQLSPEEQGARGGLGVGLALVQRVVELHGGAVEAHSDGPDRGSEFVVKLPLAVHGPQSLEAIPGHSPRETPRLRVLVADDNVDAADSLALLLQTLGHDTRTAYRGQQALEAAQAFRPHVAMLDIGMPDMNGHELARRLIAASLTPRPVIVAVTGWGQDTDRQRSREAGFDRHFVKPISEEELAKLLAGVPAEDRHEG